MSQSVSPLKIIAQPKSTHRERYQSETDRSRRCAQRFIRAVLTLDNSHDYPTIEIPQEWRDRCIYIRVTSITVPNEHVPYTCVHPYPIDTPESHVVKDKERNSLYFLVSEQEFNDGWKSFRITRDKLIQNELRHYIPLRRFNSDEKDIRNTTDIRHLMDLYQLNKSQLVFSIAELFDDGHVPVTYDATSVLSNMMRAETPFVHNHDYHIQCVPRQGDWQGGDQILMVIPRLDRRKSFHLHFEHSAMKSIIPVQVKFVDSKTIAFRTPCCPIQLKVNQTQRIPIVVTQNSEEVARVDFLYRSTKKCDKCAAIYSHK